MVQVVADRAGAEAGPDGEAARALFDAKGRFLREETGATWSLDGLKGTVARTARSRSAADAGRAGRHDQGDRRRALRRGARARRASAAVDRNVRVATPTARCRPAGSTPTAGKFSVATLDGQKVLQKAPDDTIFKRFRAFIGPVDWSNYTVEADVRGTTRRRQMADIGITAQRYSLVLYGNAQQLKIEPWEPETQRTAVVPFDVEGRHLVSPEAARREHARRQGARARQGVADRPARAGGVDDRQDRSDRQPQGRAGPLRRRGVRRLSRQPQSRRQTNEEDIARARRLVAASGLRLQADAARRKQRVRSRHRRLADVGRHARPQHGLEHEGAADRVGRQDQEEREVGRRARLAELRQPGRRRRHGVRRHQQRRRCAIRSSPAIAAC